MLLTQLWLPSASLPQLIKSFYLAPRHNLLQRSMEAAMTALKSISEKLSTWRRYRDAVRELSQLSDRELSDIGIRRGDIEIIARRSATQQRQVAN